jgi:hypothetical protein
MDRKDWYAYWPAYDRIWMDTFSIGFAVPEFRHAVYNIP